MDNITEISKCHGAPLIGVSLDRVHWYYPGSSATYLMITNVNGRGTGRSRGHGCGSYLINDKTHNDKVLLLGLTYERVMPFRITELDIEKSHG